MIDQARVTTARQILAQPGQLRILAQHLVLLPFLAGLYLMALPLFAWAFGAWAGVMTGLAGLFVLEVSAFWLAYLWRFHLATGRPLVALTVWRDLVTYWPRVLRGEVEHGQN